MLCLVLAILLHKNPLPPELYIEKTDALGVPRGPLLKQLKEGHDVELPNGRL